jgi:hypothetical protein
MVFSMSVVYFSFFYESKLLIDDGEVIKFIEKLSSMKETETRVMIHWFILQI